MSFKALNYLTILVLKALQILQEYFSIFFPLKSKKRYRKKNFFPLYLLYKESIFNKLNMLLVLQVILKNILIKFPDIRKHFS